MNVKKIAILSSPLLIFLLACLVTFYISYRNTFQSYRQFQTEVITYEGIVEVWRLKPNGEKELFKTLHAGESTFVGGKKIRTADNLLLKTFGPMMAKGTRDCVEAFAEVEKGSPQNFTRFWSEQKMNDKIIRKMDNQMSAISNANITVNSKGIKGYATVHFLAFRFDSSISAVLYPDEAGNFCVKVNWAKLGPMDIPDFVLRNLEEVFAESVRDIDLPIKFIKIEYKEDGIIWHCRRARGV